VPAPSGVPLHAAQLGSDLGPMGFVVAAADHPAWDMAGSASADPRLQKLAAVALLDPLVEQLRELGLAGAHAQSILSLANMPDEVASAPWCVARSAQGSEITFTAGQLPEAASQVLRQALAGSPGTHRWRSSLAAPGVVTLAWRAVSLSLLQSLAVGDVLLTSCEAQATNGWAARVSFGASLGRRLCVSCRIAELTLSVEGAPHMTDETDVLSGAQPQETAGKLDELDIPLRFELETVAVPLAELEAIQPGYVIELAMPLSSATLRLVAFGQVLGHAQLVAVGDKLGARITRLVSRDERQSTH
jgi:type III secretion protein Q